MKEYRIIETFIAVLILVLVPMMAYSWALAHSSPKIRYSGGAEA